MFKNKREFLYELGDVFYIIGGNACGECFDPELISEYRHFEKLTSNAEFALHPRDMHKVHRDAVAESYEKIANACYVPVEESRPDNEAKMLRDELEEQFQDEIEKQLDIWIKALDCKDYRDMGKG